MNYSPVVIPTLCRSTHLIRCIESLSLNTLAGETDVFIGLDAPARTTHQSGYHEICEYLKRFDHSKFKSLNVVVQDHNVGPRANVDALLSVVLQKYDRFIYAEDDIEFSPYFLEFMDKALECYKADSRVDAICGYSYPLDWGVGGDANAFLCDSTFSAWGYGTWKEKYVEKRMEIEKGLLDRSFERSCQNGEIKKLINNRRAEYVFYSGLGASPGTSRKCIDITSAIYLTLRHRYVVVPKTSLVRNWGFDGSGVNCEKARCVDGANSQTYDYTIQPLAGSDLRSPVVDEGESTSIRSRELLDKYLFIPWYRVLFADLYIFAKRHDMSVLVGALVAAYNFLSRRRRKG